MQEIKVFTGFVFIGLAFYLAQVDGERECIEVAREYRIFDLKCLRRSDWKTELDNSQFRIDCRCTGWTVKECVQCNYQDSNSTITTTQEPTETTSRDTTETETEVPTTTTDATFSTDPDPSEGPGIFVAPIG